MRKGAGFVSKYMSLSHSKSRIRYHFVVSAKYRRKCFVGIEEDVKRVFSVAARRCDKVKLLAVGVDKDHVHFIIQATPSVSPSQIVSRMKQLTTRMLWKEHEQVPSHFYWGNKKGKLWTNGYFCETVGNVSEEKMLDYVSNQGNTLR